MNSTRRPRFRRRTSKHNCTTTSRAKRRASDALVIIREPVSSEDVLCAATVDHLEALHLSNSWFAKLPAHIGQSLTLDAAARAFISSNRYSLHCKDASVATCLQDYLRAIRHQRQLTSTTAGRLSDEALLSCALLGHFERTMGQRYGPDAIAQTLKQTLMHLEAMQKMLLDRLNTFQTHQLDYTIVFDHHMLLLEAPIATGTPCAFERLALPHPRTIVNDKTRCPAARLSRLAAELMLRAPRLIADVRACKNAASDTLERKRVELRAQSLLHLQDEAAENTLLHNVSVKPTEPGAGPTPFSFTFRSLVHFDACLRYWHARLLILRTCRLLDVPAQREEVQTQGRRALNNMLMSWQYGHAQLFMRIRFVHGACTVWGAVAEFGVGGATVEEIYAFAVARINGQYKGIVPGTTKVAMDEVSAVYAGGPLEGAFLELYHRHWPGGREYKGSMPGVSVTAKDGRERTLPPYPESLVMFTATGVKCDSDG